MSIEKELDELEQLARGEGVKCSDLDETVYNSAAATAALVCERACGSNSIREQLAFIMQNDQSGRIGEDLMKLMRINIRRAKGIMRKITKITIEGDDGSTLVFENEEADAFCSAVLKLHGVYEKQEAEVNVAFEYLLAKIREKHNVNA